MIKLYRTFGIIGVICLFVKFIQSGVSGLFQGDSFVSEHNPQEKWGPHQTSAGAKAPPNISEDSFKGGVKKRRSGSTLSPSACLRP